MLSNITYFLLSLFSLLKHILIPAICLIIIIVLFRKKWVIKLLVPLLLVVTVGSYFVGIYSAPKICNENFSVPTKENYFYVNDDDFTFNGKIFIYEKETFTTDYLDVFENDEIFDLNLSSIGKYTLKNNIGFKDYNMDEFRVIYSSLVMCKNNFFIGRNNYAGYVIIEDSETIIYIPYELHFKESFYNDLTFTKIYSNVYQININSFMNHIVTESDYLNLRYS